MSGQQFTPSVASTSTLDSAILRQQRDQQRLKELVAERDRIGQDIAALDRAIDMLTSGRKPDADDLAAFDRAVDLLPRYENVRQLARELRGEPAKGETCHHGRALAGEGCPACGAEAGEPVDPAKVREVQR